MPKSHSLIIKNKNKYERENKPLLIPYEKLFFFLTAGTSSFAQPLHL